MRLRTIIRTLLIKPSVWLCCTWTNEVTISVMRRCNHIQLSVSELKKIIDRIKSKTNCALLVFGAGNDSLLWASLNEHGRTVFLEDNETWLQTVKARDAISDIYLVNYETQCSEWKSLLSQPDKLAMALPDAIADVNWDVILVDAPAGWYDTAPGRMKSIYQTSLFIHPSLDVFVHDCNREIEINYCDRFLKPKHMVEQIEKLRHYHF